MFHVHRNQLLLLICPFISSFFFLSNFQHWSFLSEFWNLVHTWTVGRCILSTGIRLLLLIHPFISSFFFHFLSLFLGTVKPRILKLGTHVDSGQIYHVYRNQAAAYLSLYFFIFLSPQFSTLKFFVTLFSGTVRPRRLKIGTHVDSGQMYHVYWNRLLLLIHPFISSFLHFSFSPIFNIEVFHQSFLRKCEA